MWFFFIALAGWLTAWFFVYKKLKQKLWFIASLLVLLFSVWGLIHLRSVQNYIVKKVTAVLSDKLQTKVEIKHVDFSLFNNMLIEGVLVQDLKKDTLLYAGTATVNITDWFFLKDKATLNYLALKNTVINLNRTDSVWNYAYLINFFSSPSTSSSGKKGLEFDFKKIELENFSFTKIDKWVGQDLSVAVTKAVINADSMDLTGKFFAVNSITLNQPVFSQNNYTGNRPANYKRAQPAITTTLPPAYKWNNDGWLFSVNSITINNGSFKNERETERLPYTDRFDGQHLLFTTINGTLKNVRFEKDTLHAAVTLATKERSGFTIKKLAAQMQFTPDVMEFKNLDLQTNTSRLGNYYAMRYQNFNSDMSDFLHSVTLQGKFENSKLTSSDLAFFAPALKPWNRQFDITGQAAGTIDNLVAKNMLIKSGNTLVDGNISLRGLPDIENTFIDFTSRSLVTNYSDLTAIVPALKNVTQPNLNRLGNISFKGNFTGFINDFVTYGNINTNLGIITADINMKLPQNKPATYSGKIFSPGFKLGQFINNSSLGNIALDGNVNGSGFALNELKAGFAGHVRQLQFSGYTYNNIAIDGTFNKKLFSGSGSVNDPNLKIENFKGAIDFNNKIPAFNFDAFLKNSNFKKLRLTNEDFELAGHFNLNFTGRNIDDFLGNVRVNNATLVHNSNRLSFDMLGVQSYITDGVKHLSFQTNEAEGNVAGKFKILELPDAFSVFLSRYYPAYIKKPKRTVTNQNFTFLIKTKNADEYVQLLDKKLKGFNDATFSGSLNLAQNELNLNAYIPSFEYDKKLFNNLDIKSSGNADTLTTVITAGDVVLNDSLHFPGTNLTIKSHNDISQLQLKTSASKTLSEAELNATVQTLNDGVKIHFSPSSFIVNDKKWQLEKDGELTIRKSYIDASEVKFIQGNQEITFSTEMAKNGTDNTNVVARLKKVNINDFTPLFLKNPRLEGVLTGTITLSDPFGKPVIGYDAEAEDFRLDDKLIGKTKLKGDVNTVTGLITGKVNADGTDNKFSIDLKYNYKDDSSNNQMDINFLAERFNIDLLNNYLGTIFSDIKGNAESTLKITGGKKKKDLTGSVTITDGSLKVNFTQCRYNFSNETIIFNPGEIDLGSLKLTDTLGNAGTARGKILHGFFDEFYFDNLYFKTGDGSSAGKMLLLNTTAKDNSNIYGKVTGNATMNLNGPVTNMKMKITGEPSLTDSSHIFLPTGDSRESGTIDYIEFIQFGTVMEDVKSKQGSNILVDMDIKANPACKIDVILDEATGDIIKGQGNGLLNIRVGTREPLTMNGRYDITQGEYKFNFQTILNRYFSINKGYITWSGDPYKAQINIDAEYIAPRVDLQNLQLNNSQKSQQKSDIFIVSHISNTLESPKITFEFKLDENSDYSKDPIVLENLKRFARDSSEMNRQVASLLLFNTFISSQSGGLGGSTVSFISGTVGQILSGFLSSQLTRLFQRYIKDPTITPIFSLNSNYDATNPALLNALQASGNVGFKKEYLDGRLIFSLTGAIDYNNPYVLQANVLITPDFTVEYILSKNGKLRIVGFKKNSVDATFGQRSKAGVRLSYQKEFDKKRNRIDADKPKAKKSVKGVPEK